MWQLKIHGSILRSDQLSYYQAIQATGSEKRRLFGGEKGLKSSFNQLKFFFILGILTKQLDFTKTIIPLALMGVNFDSEPVRARGIIVKISS